MSISEVDEFFGEKTVFSESESIDVEEEVRIRREEKRLQEKREREQRDKELHGDNFDYDVVQDIKKAPTLYWGSEEDVAKTAGLDEPIQDEKSDSQSEEDSLLEDLEIDGDISYGRAGQEPSGSGKGRDGSKDNKGESKSRLLTEKTTPHLHQPNPSSLHPQADDGQPKSRAARRLLEKIHN